MRNTSVKIIPITSIDSYALLVNSPVKNYILTGTKTISTNFAITASASPTTKKEVWIWNQATITVSGTPTFTILGTTVDLTVIQHPFVAICAYINSVWQVAIIRIYPTIGSSTIGIDGATGAISVLSGSLSNTLINSAAAIAYSKLNLSGALLNSDLHTNFAMPVNQLAALTPSQLAAYDSNGFLQSLAVATYPSLAELARVKGLTYNAQDQITAIVSALGNYVLTSTLSAYSDTTAMNAAIASAIATAKPLWDGTTLATATDLSLLATMRQEYLLDASGGTVPVITGLAANYPINTPLMFTLYGASTPCTISPKGSDLFVTMGGTTTAATVTLNAVGDFVKFISSGTNRWRIIAQKIT